MDKKEYDKDGNKIYCENSRDGIIFDKRPKNNEMVNIPGMGEVSMETVKSALRDKFK